MDALKALIGLARSSVAEASRALPRTRPPAADATSPLDDQRNIARPVEGGEGPAEADHKAAWFRRKGRAEAEGAAGVGAGGAAGESETGSISSPLAVRRAASPRRAGTSG